MSTISVRLNDDDTTLFKKYAELNNLTISELVRKTIIEKIEDEFDLRAYDEALAEYKNNPVTYSLDEVEKELGLK